MLRVALPNKGRLAEDARELFADAGLEVRARGDRALTASLGGEFEAIFVRARRTSRSSSPMARPTSASRGGISCANRSASSECCSISSSAAAASWSPRATTAASTSIDDFAASPRVATVFPHLTRRFFEQAGKPVTIVPVSGAAEIAPHLGIADVIVDLTSTGSTLRVNGLREVATVLESSARLIALDQPRAEPRHAR